MIVLLKIIYSNHTCWLFDGKILLLIIMTAKCSKTYSNNIVKNTFTQEIYK